MRLQSCMQPLSLLLQLRSSKLIECASEAIFRRALHADDALAKRALTEAVVPERAHATPMAITSQFQASRCLDSLPCRRSNRPSAHPHTPQLPLQAQADTSKKADDITQVWSPWQAAKQRSLLIDNNPAAK